ncbi:MAG: phosphatase [Chitinispirillia bacterium]|nr:phosphatase [Chitinispirillia bacterium]MCL2242139.1 phosphatase [Chitinispirillia bacterium]
MVAIIDIGSNTIRLCVYEISADGDIRQMFKMKDVVGLAGHIDKKNLLTQDGIKETCASLTKFREALAGMDISETHTFATASLRNILNTAQVVEAVKRATGYDVTVISGEEEAICDFMGATNRTPITDGLLVDIGGGSTELVLCKNGKLEQAASVAIGSLNMFSRHVSRVLPSRAQTERIRADAADKLTAAFKSKPISAICGVGGSMRALYKLNNSVFNEPPENRIVSAKNAKKLLGLIETDTHMMVGKILNICPERIHTITPGFIILGAIIRKYGCKTIIVSESGVREGYLIRNVLRRDIGKPGTPVALVSRNGKGGGGGS